MSDTIRWCFTHHATELPSLERFCTYGWSDTSVKCDIQDGLVVRADQPVYRMVASLSQQAYPNEGEVLVHAIMQRIGAET